MPRGAWNARSIPPSLCNSLISRTLIFVSEHSHLFFMTVCIRITDPMIRAMAILTPPFLIDRMKPLYVAWFVFMIRFYLMPLLLGYDVMGMLSFPLESDAALIIYDFGQIFR